MDHGNIVCTKKSRDRDDSHPVLGVQCSSISLHGTESPNSTLIPSAATGCIVAIDPPLEINL